MGRKKHESKPYKYHFSDAEILELSRVAAGYPNEIDSLKADFDRLKAEHKERENEARAAWLRASRCIREGYEIRNVECEIVLDRAENLVKWVRTDTGEILDSRLMTDKEKQYSFDDIEEV